MFFKYFNIVLRWEECFNKNIFIQQNRYSNNNKICLIIKFKKESKLKIMILYSPVFDIFTFEKPPEVIENSEFLLDFHTLDDTWYIH